MTYEEARQQADPFTDCWLWTTVPRLDHEGWRYAFVVRTCDDASTLFNFTESTCEHQIKRVRDPSDLLWDHVLRDRSGNGWHSGSVNDMLRWGRRLFHDV